MMKTSTLFKTLTIFTVALLTIHCDDQDDTTSTIPADVYTSLDGLIATLKEDPEIFTITDPSVQDTISGANGVQIIIYPNAFTNSSGVITTPITCELTEFLTLDKMLLNNVQTSSNGNLLVTGGSFELNFYDENGDDVTANGWNMFTSFPIQTNITGYENTMGYFTGERVLDNGRDVVNWFEENDVEAWTNNETFNVYGLEQGFSNCDVLYEMANENPTQFEATVTGVDDYDNTAIWMVVEDFPSVILLTSEGTTGLATYENSIPTGVNATLIAITIDEDNYLKFGSTPITVNGDDVFNIDTEYGTTEELSTLMNTIVQ